MRQRAIFQKIRNFVIAQGYTIEQVKNVTPIQVKNLLNLTDEEFLQYQIYLDGIKKLIIQDLQDVIDVQILADLKQQIHAYLVTKFPDYEVEKDFNDKSNRTVTFYLDGIPE